MCGPQGFDTELAGNYFLFKQVGDLQTLEESTSDIDCLDWRKLSLSTEDSENLPV